MDREVEISKEEINLAVSVACMAICGPTPGFKGRTFKLCVWTERQTDIDRQTIRQTNRNGRSKIIIIIILTPNQTFIQ